MSRYIRLAIVGSRNFCSQYLVERFVYELPDKVVIVTGGARGVDTWAEETAKHHNRDVQVHRANWKKHGKMAGFLRNNAIIRDCDLVAAFWDGSSKGTRHSIQLAKYLGKDCIIVRAKNDS